MIAAKMAQFISAIWKTTSVRQDPPRPRLGSRIAERFASLGWSAERPELRGRMVRR
jgi:hypothetical protein